MILSLLLHLKRQRFNRIQNNYPANLIFIEVKNRIGQLIFQKIISLQMDICHNVSKPALYPEQHFLKDRLQCEPVI